MIYRQVLFKLNDAADENVVDNIRSYVKRIRTELNEVRVYHFAKNQAPDTRGYDWVLFCAFDSVADMDAYREAPVHLEFIDFCHPYTDDTVISFFEGPDAI